MPFTIAAIIILSALAQGQQLDLEKQQAHAEKCGVQAQGLLTYWYSQAVWEHILPQDRPRSLITISVSLTGTPSKLIVRAADAVNFELLRGTPLENFDVALDNLNKSCRLPLNPIEAAKLIRTTWERVDLPSNKAAQIHRDFTTALSEYSANMQKRYNSLLSTALTFQRIHTAQYSVVYDNRFEHAEVRADDVTDDPARMDPIVRWARGILKLSEDSFRKKSNAYLHDGHNQNARKLE